MAFCLQLQLATVLSVLTCCVLAQAPGDGDAFCDVNQNDTIPAPGNVRVLMDSRDYVDLLQGENPVWQQVDNDRNNAEDVATSVSIIINFPRKI